MVTLGKRPAGGPGQKASEFFWIVSFFLDHYKLISYVAAIAAALGFAYYTPGQVAKNLQAQVDLDRATAKHAVDSTSRELNLRIDKLDDSYQLLFENQQIQIRALCLSPQFTVRERSFMGLTPSKCGQ
jgi:hypothetical protein